MLLVSTLWFSSPAWSKDDVDLDCAHLLVSHVHSQPDGFLKWSVLGRHLERRDSATLLVKIPLKDAVVPFQYLQRLGLPENLQVKIPTQFMVLAQDSMLAVVIGSRQQLLEAARILPIKFQDLSFQILGSVASKRKFEISFPTKAREIKARADLTEMDNSLSEAGKERFLIFDEQTQNMTFMIPRAELLGLTASLLGSLGIKQSEISDEQGMASWLRANQANMTAKTMVRWRSFWAVSQPAFLALKSLEGTELSVAQTSNVQVATELKAQLKACHNEVCDIELEKPKQPLAPVESRPELPLSATNVIPLASMPDEQSSALDPDLYNLRENKRLTLLPMAELISLMSGRSIFGRQGVERAFSGVVEQYLTDAEAEVVRRQLEAISFGLWDGRSFNEFLDKGVGAYLVVDRFVQAWRALTEAINPELAEKPLNVENVRAGILALQSRYKNPPARSQSVKVLSPDPVSVPARSTSLLKSSVLDHDDVKIVVRFISSAVPQARIHTTGQIGEALLTMIQQLVLPTELPRFREAISAIELKRYDIGNSFAAGKARDRVMAAWSVFVGSMGPEWAKLDLNRESILSVIAEFQRRTQRVAAVSAAAEPARPPVTVSPPPVPAPSVGQATKSQDDAKLIFGITHFLSFMSRQVPEARVSLSGRLPNAFLAMVQKVGTADDVRQAETDIEAIQFRKSDYNAVLHSPPARHRILLGISLVARAVDPALLSRTLNDDLILQIKTAFEAKVAAGKPGIKKQEPEPDSEQSQVEAEIRSTLEGAANSVAKATPAALLRPNSEDDVLDFETRDAILRFLRDQIRLGKLQHPDGVRRAFLDSVTSLWIQTPSLKPEYLPQFEAVGFKKQDFAALDSGKSRFADQRLLKAWRLLQRMIDDPNLDLVPLTKASIEETYRLYDSRVGVVRFVERSRQVVDLTAEALSQNRATDSTSRTDGQGPLTVTKSARAELIAAGLRAEEIDLMIGKWNGIRVTGGLPGYGGTLDWTLLFRTREMWNSGGYSRDDAYTVILQDNVVTKLIEHKDAEMKYYRQVSRDLQIAEQSFRIDIPREDNRQRLEGNLELSPATVVKLNLKHGLSFDELKAILRDAVIEKLKEDGCYKLRKLEPTGKNTRYLMCVAEFDNAIKLKTLFPQGTSVR